MIESGDLERVVNLVRVLGSAGDALSDDIVGRLGQMINDLLCLADRISRNENLDKLLDLLERDHMVDTLTSLCEAAATTKAAHTTAASGGVMNLLSTMKDPEVQQALQFMSKFSAAFRGS